MKRQETSRVEFFDRGTSFTSTPLLFPVSLGTFTDTFSEKFYKLSNIIGMYSAFAIHFSSYEIMGQIMR